MDIDRMRVARPHLVRAGLAGLIALIALVVAGQAEKPLGRSSPRGDLTTSEIVCTIAVVCALVFGVAAIRALVEATKVATSHAGRVGKRTPLSFITALVGYAIVLLSALSAIGYPPGGLLLGGAFTGIVIGIAAQQTLGNIVAGFMLLLVRPFTVGEHVVLRGGPLSGEYSGLVTEMSLFYVHLMTERGPVALPNAAVLAAAVGPGARTEPETAEDEEDPERRPDDPGPEHGGTPGAP